MKNVVIWSVFLLSMFLFSCSSVNTLTLSVTEPAPVFLSNSAKKIGVLNRSEPDEKSKNLDKLDKILTAEGKDLDRDAANEATKAVHDELKGYERFTEVKIIDNKDIKTKFTGNFPPPIEPETIERLCSENNVDAMFVLSYFDTDASIEYKTQNVEITTPIGINVPAIEHHAIVKTLVKSGWRIYYPEAKAIVDEYYMNQTVVTEGKGINPQKAVEALTGRKAAVNQAAYDMGRNYPPRILPNRIRVSRLYYVRGTDNFEIAKRRAQTGDWDGAAELWEKEINNSDMKVAGRAHYNMAIISEINGNLEKAIEWASKSYTDYNDKHALSLLNVLRYRVSQQEELRQQQQE